jgi:hypothetical protein
MSGKVAPDAMSILSKIMVTPTFEGKASGSPRTADTLWSGSPVAVFVARRPSCPICRLDAQVLSKLFQKPQYSHIKLICIVKEVATDSDYITDKIVGIEAFQTQYFNNSEVYVDPERKFYEYFGNKSMAWQPYSLTPCGLYTDFHFVLDRMREAKIDDYNFYGEGWLKGGFLLISPIEGVVYQHAEMTGSLLPLNDIEEAARGLLNKYRQQLGLSLMVKDDV